MDWRASALGCMLAYGISTYCFAKANPVHGAKVASLMQVVGYVILLTALGFGRDDLRRITRESLVFGALGAALAVCGTYLVFGAISSAPKQSAVIEAISSAFPVIAALMIHFLIRPMAAMEWFGIVIITCGVVVLNLAAPP